MSERRFMIKELSDPSKWNLFPVPSITETEFHRRIDLAFRAAFCALDETFDYNKAIDIIVNGYGDDLTPRRDEEGHIIGFGKASGEGEKEERRTEMGERKFYLRQLDEDGSLPIDLKGSIPESELKRRIWEIQKSDATYSKAIDILLHGSDPCYICGKVDGHEPFCSREPVQTKRTHLSTSGDQPYTKITIETCTGEDTLISMVQTGDTNLNGADLAQLFKQCMMGIGYHWDTVRQVFNEEEE